MGKIQHQSIFSTIIIYLGFVLGAINVIFLFPKLLNEEEVGLIRTLLDAALMLGNLALLSANHVNFKFAPFYRSYLPAKKIDLQGLLLVMTTLGIILVVLLIFWGKPLMVRKFSANAKLFTDYYYYLIPLTVFIALFEYWISFSINNLRTIFPNFVKEVISRVFITVLIVLYYFHILTFKQFIGLYSSLYFCLFVLVAVYVKFFTEVTFTLSISSVTRKLWKKILTYQSFVWSGIVFYVISQYVDTFIISGLVGLSGTAVFSIATFIATIIQVPQRAMLNISIPIISKAWKDKNYKSIESIYAKSSINLLIASLVIFVLVWSSIDNLFSILPPKYSEGKYVLLLLGIARVIDMGTGLNNIVILTSNKWRFDFITGIILICCIVGLNYTLVKSMGIIGSAWSNLISFTIYNAIRYIFLWKTFGFQPFTSKTVLAIIGAFGIYYLQTLLPYCHNWFWDTVVRSTVICSLFLIYIYKTTLSADFHKIIQDYLLKGFKR